MVRHPHGDTSAPRGRGSETPPPAVGDTELQQHHRATRQSSSLLGTQCGTGGSAWGEPPRGHTGGRNTQRSPQTREFHPRPGCFTPNRVFHPKPGVLPQTGSFTSDDGGEPRADAPSPGFGGFVTSPGGCCWWHCSSAPTWVFCPQQFWGDGASPGLLVWGQKSVWICPHGASLCPVTRWPQRGPQCSRLSLSPATV